MRMLHYEMSGKPAESLIEKVTKRLEATDAAGREFMEKYGCERISVEFGKVYLVNVTENSPAYPHVRRVRNVHQYEHDRYYKPKVAACNRNRRSEFQKDLAEFMGKHFTLEDASNWLCVQWGMDFYALMGNKGRRSTASWHPTTGTIHFYVPCSSVDDPKVPVGVKLVGSRLI